MVDGEDEALKAASAYAKDGDFERAVLSLKELLQINPRHEIAVGMLAAIYA